MRNAQAHTLHTHPQERGASPLPPEDTAWPAVHTRNTHATAVERPQQSPCNCVAPENHHPTLGLEQHTHEAYETTTACIHDGGKMGMRNLRPRSYGAGKHPLPTVRARTMARTIGNKLRARAAMPSIRTSGPLPGGHHCLPCPSVARSVPYNNLAATHTHAHTCACRAADAHGRQHILPLPRCGLLLPQRRRPSGTNDGRSLGNFSFRAAC